MKQNLFEKFHEWYENRHEHTNEWKEKTGGKVLGYFCTYTPEEIIYAAGVLPVRILGSHEAQSVTEPHIFAMYCPLCRDCLAQGLLGRYDYLDGITLAQCCLHMRQTFTSWRKHIPLEYDYYLYMPHGIQTPRAYPYLRGELEDFRKSLEKWTRKKITDQDLDHAIEAYNENRRLMKQVYEFRKGKNPKLTGLEAMEMVVSSQMTDKEEHNQALKELLKELPNRNVNRKTGTRLMILGSEDDDAEFLRMVESTGATFVIEDHCTGSRYFWNEVIPQEDRLSAIAARYIDRPPCPSKDWPERSRLPYILKLAKDYNVEGVLLIQQKFCDPHELDIPAIRSHLEKNGIPTYFLEFDVTVPVGQFKTRVEAFLETFQLPTDLF